MNFYEVTFSPTGDTKKVADILSQSLSEQISEIDLCDRNVAFSEIAMTEDDVALIAVPPYGGRVPLTAIDRISVLNGNNAKAVENRIFAVLLLDVENCLLKDVLFSRDSFSVSDSCPDEKKSICS